MGSARKLIRAKMEKKIKTNKSKLEFLYSIIKMKENAYIYVPKSMSAPFPLIFPFNTLKKTFKICLARKLIRVKSSLICTARNLIRAKLYQNHGARKLVRAKISTNKVK